MSLFEVLATRIKFLDCKKCAQSLNPSEEALDCLIFSGSKFKLQ